MKILLADDHPLIREAVKTHLRKLDRSAVIIEAVDYPSAFEVARRNHDLDLALLDLTMPGMGSEEGITGFRFNFPDVPLVILSGRDEPDNIEKLLAVGTLGYITKASSGDVILSALRLVLSGGVYLPPSLLNRKPLSSPEDPLDQFNLTERQRHVLRHLTLGKSNREIGEALGLSEGTVKVHMTTILRILKLRNRTEALLMAQKLGLGLPRDPEDHAE